MKKEKIIEIIMAEEDGNIVVNINNLAETNVGHKLAKQFFQAIHNALNYDNLEYAIMKTDKGEVNLKND